MGHYSKDTATVHGLLYRLSFLGAPTQLTFKYTVSQLFLLCNDANGGGGGGETFKNGRGVKGQSTVGEGRGCAVADGTERRKLCVQAIWREV